MTLLGLQILDGMCFWSLNLNQNNLRIACLEMLYLTNKQCLNLNTGHNN